MSPTAPYTAFDADGDVPIIVDDSELEPGFRTLSLNNFTSWANVTFRPAISIPAGLVDGLPVGLQVGARHHREDQLLRLARIMEQVQPWPRVAPMAQPAAV
jgi:aspartyl-tRNA(Asn)/glutamyl-tRNA(Gln) amidotransferase subunit A